MMWEKIKLQDCCLSIADGDHQPPPKMENGIPFITIANFTNTNNIDFTNTMFVPDKYYQQLDNKRKAQSGDVLYSVVGSFGIPILIKEERPFVFQRHIAILRPDKNKIEPAFLFYTMLNPLFYAKADAVAIGSAQRTISLGALRNLKIDLPNLSLQQRIVQILSAYDDLIEVNQKQIRLLEEAARRLYKEWFIDLRFPGHENTAITNGIPEGWKQEMVSSIAPILTGKKDANYGTPSGKYPFFTCAQEPLHAENFSFDNNAIILAGNGDFNVKLYRGKFEAYQRTYVLIPYKQCNLFNLFFTIQENMRLLTQGANGSTIKFLTKGMIEKIKILIPDLKTLTTFNSFMDSIQSDIEHLQRLNVLSIEARNRLLPKLMSGEIEV